MTGVKSFILGFSISLCGVALYGQSPSSLSQISKPFPSKNIEIHLFKRAEAHAHLTHDNLFKPIKKEILEIGKDSVIAQNSVQQSKGIEDDEILSIDDDDIIPIEYETSYNNLEQTEVIQNDTDESRVALLPSDMYGNEQEITDTPWVTVKGGSNIKNKKLLEQINHTANNTLLDDFNENIKESDSVSYKVAERIKQSIIFPIPDEILNDENLTPTFINSKRKTSPQPQKTEKAATPVAIKQTPPQVTPSRNPVVKEQKTDKGLMGSISSWFSATPEKEEKVTLVKKAAPAYSSPASSSTQNSTVSQPKAVSKRSDLASFYESLQETKKIHAQRKIVPTELTLSFQPNRAEISGTTLHWLKVFSEAAISTNNHLQIRLDIAASNELQKKRLNLLYTIFMNNGVSFENIDTVFSQTEPNTFVIRTIRPNI